MRLGGPRCSPMRRVLEQEDDGLAVARSVLCVASIRGFETHAYEVAKPVTRRSCGLIATIGRGLTFSLASKI